MKVRARSLALALAGLVVLAACGGGGANAAERVREAPEKTAAAGSAQVALRLDFTTGGVGGAVTGDGAVDLRGRAAALTVDLGSLGGSFASGTIEAFLDSTGIYVKLGPPLLTAAKPWVKLDLATLGQQLGANTGGLGQLQSIDPTQVIQFLEGAVSDMKEVGEEQVRGTDTTHYRGTVDLKRASEAVSPEAKQAVDQAVGTLGTSTFPADVWLDDEGRLRRMRFSASAPATASSPAGTVELELFNFGAPVEVTPPPADQTTNLASLFGGLPR